MLNYRRERAEQFILEELSLILQNEVADPRVAPLTVTAVSLTKDRRIAKIYVTCYSGEEDLQAGLAGLESAKGYLRSRLSELLAWRFTPELLFVPDRTWQKAARIEQLFQEIERERATREDHEQSPS
ncbi:MAG: 30S ribosome-binding factor RbfA [Chloroflexi bacterium]|nr:30S ribosome-binding factor RbfA [Chloroflexota bacterium]